MINSVIIYNELGETITMELRRPELSGFLVRYIDGLGPPKANIEMTEMSLMDGALYNSARSLSRNIMFSLIFEPSGEETIETVRQKTYKYFSLKKRITMVFETETRTCQAFGYVESNVPEIFSKREGTNISVRCPSSYLQSLAITRTTFSVVTPLFEFPFSNESLTEKLIEFSELLYNPIQVIYYEGDADVGILITLHAIGVAENITIYNTESLESIEIDTDRLETLTGEGFHAQDDIIISTVKGNKYAKLVREGVETNILNCLNKYPDWFQLHKGDNIFTFTAEVGESNIQCTIENLTVYEGI